MLLWRWTGSATREASSGFDPPNPPGAIDFVSQGERLLSRGGSKVRSGRGIGGLTFDEQRAREHQRIFVECRALTGLLSARGRLHTRNAQASLSIVHAADELVDQLGFVTLQR